MADVPSVLVPFDLDSGAGTELILGVNLRSDASGGSVQALTTAAALADNTSNPTVAGIANFGMVFDGTNWDRMQGTTADGVLVNLGGNNDVTVTGAVDTELPAAVAAADNLANPTAPQVLAHGMVFDGATWDRMLGDSTDGVTVNLGANNDVTITGSVDTELPAAVAAADDLANPTAPQVLSHLMGFDSGNTNWNRVEVDDAGHLQVDVLTGGGTDAPTNPVISGADATTPTNVAAGAEGDIDTPEAASKKLALMQVWSSVAFRCRVYTVDNGVESTDPVAVGGAVAFGTFEFRPTHRDYVTLGATAGLDAFRAEVKNLDDNQAADFYMVAHYED